ncbi:MAG: AmmeMemoRadiSam system protein A [Defluviitaleaceae bacterium]|nr:AmmeMemoRadiSam system protein A [Defluviitaleaceae bacterium]MCL2836638.1 AmmeMemoRadiSam system protein A [Defluviitaleaceae bacterium]
MNILAGYIMPHPPLAVEAVGKGSERGIPETMSAYHEIGRRISEMKPETIVVISPHAPTYADYFHISPGKAAAGDFGVFGEPGVKVTVNYDNELSTAISGIADREGISAGLLGETPENSALDHGVMVPLWFVNKYTDYAVVRVSTSGLPPEEHYKLGMCIKSAIGKLGRKTVIVASGDLSHKLKERGNKGEECRAFDAKITGIMRDARFEELLMMGEDERYGAADCGSGAFMILAGILSGMLIKPEFLSYEGTFGVGYAQCAYHILSETGGDDYLALYKERMREAMAAAKDSESGLPRLARNVVEAYVQTKRLPVKTALDQEYRQTRAGVFVTIKKHGTLRGCIGTLEPTTASIADEVRQNAVSACSRDFRFDPVEPGELPFLTYGVDVLSEPEPVDYTRLQEKLDPKTYGVIVTHGSKRGVLLPDLEGIDTVSQQLEIALKKAGISGELYNIERFKVTRHT